MSAKLKGRWEHTWTRFGIFIKPNSAFLIAQKLRSSLSVAQNRLPRPRKAEDGEV